MEDSPPRAGRSTFAWLVGASQLVGLASVVVTGVWMGHYRGGFAWDGSTREFNLHPLCMVLGLVFLQGDGRSLSLAQPQWARVYNSFECLLDVLSGWVCALLVAVGSLIKIGHSWSHQYFKSERYFIGTDSNKRTTSLHHPPSDLLMWSLMATGTVLVTIGL